MVGRAHREVSIAGYCLAAACAAMDDLEAADEPGARGQYACVALVMTAAASEASMNVLISNAVERRWAGEQAKTITARLYWSPPASKPAIICELVNAPVPDMKSRPLSSLIPLFVTRNEIMHGKPRVLPPVVASTLTALDDLPDELQLDWERVDIVPTVRQYIDDVKAVEQMLGPPNELGTPMTMRSVFRHEGFYSLTTLSEAPSASSDL